MRVDSLSIWSQHARSRSGTQKVTSVSKHGEENWPTTPGPDDTRTTQKRRHAPAKRNMTGAIIQDTKGAWSRGCRRETWNGEVDQESHPSHNHSHWQMQPWHGNWQNSWHDRCWRPEPQEEHGGWHQEEYSSSSPQHDQGWRPER